MKSVRGFWLPEHEEHLVPFLQKGPTFANGPTYQLHKLQACFPHIKNFRRAIDIGAHCGLWSRPLSHCFEQIEAFEPIPEHRECWKKNVNGPAKTQLHGIALAESQRSLRFKVEDKSSGDTSVRNDYGTGPEQMSETLDSFGFENVDFIKIDCEGFEYFVVKGGEQLIRKNQPCMIVEQKLGKGAKYGIRDDQAISLLMTWGAKKRDVISGDYIMSW